MDRNSSRPLGVSPVLEVRNLRKNYGALRPLRISALSVLQGERVAVLGVDAPAAEIFSSLITGASLPEEGDVRLFGRDTAAITGADDWMTSLDRIGMVSARAVLAEDLTVAQSIAMAFTLSLDPVPDAVQADVRRLARDAGLADTDVGTRIGDATPLVRARCRLARAIALGPSMLLLDHANALVPAHAEVLGREMATLAKSRGMALLALTADRGFARAVADRVLLLNGATGELADQSGWRGWFRLGACP